MLLNREFSISQVRMASCCPEYRCCLQGGEVGAVHAIKQERACVAGQVIPM